MSSWVSVSPRLLAWLAGASVALSSACRPEPLVERAPAPAPTLAEIKAIPEGPSEPRHCTPLEAALPQVDPPDPPVPSIVDAGALDHFYGALAALGRHQAKDHVRIAVFGDSNLTMDFPTGHLRRLLQSRFGDGGHGFVALGKPWSHYQHMDVRHGVVSGWKAYAVTTSPTGDGLYGLAGIAVENQWQGASTFVATAPSGSPVGTSASRFDVFFLERARGGTFEVKLDGASEGLSTTRSPEKKLGVTRVSAPDGPHRLDVISRSPEVVRVFGVALERETPGIVIDTFGVGSLNSRTMTRYDPALVAEMLKARRYDLLVYMTGANDLFTMPTVPDSIHRLIAAQRDALPEVSVLVLTPADRGRARSFAPTLRVVEQRRAVAQAEHAAFWDLWSAMGGFGSMKRFVDSQLAYDDAVHFTDKGGAFVASRLDRALMESFAAYLSAHPEAGCDEPSGPPVSPLPGSARPRSAASR